MLLKAITLNIHHGEGEDHIVDVERQSNLLAPYSPDIVFLQETDMYTKRSNNENQIYDFSKNIDLSYRTMGTTITLEDGFYGDGIISRHPIDFCANYLMPSTDTSHEQRGILFNKISFGSTKINLFSVHMSTYEEERILAAKELLRILNKIDPKEGIIVGGDFNVGKIRLGKGNYRYEEKEKFEEYEILKQKLNHIGNTDYTWSSGNSKACIDTMFYSNNITLQKIQTIYSNGLTDHNAVYVEFNI